MHWRYHLDPPEFFTVLAGGIDGQHWGCYLDDPAAACGCVAYYEAEEDFELSVDGDDLFAAVRLYLEDAYGESELSLAEGVLEPDEFESQREFLDHFREVLIAAATGERSEIGDAYVDRYSGVAPGRGQVVAETGEGMGIVVPPECYRPLSRKDAKLWPYLCETDDPLDVVEEARQALREGFRGHGPEAGQGFVGRRR